MYINNDVKLGELTMPGVPPEGGLRWAQMRVLARPPAHPDTPAAATRVCNRATMPT